MCPSDRACTGTELLAFTIVYQVIDFCKFQTVSNFSPFKKN